MIDEAIRYMKELPENKLASVLDYIRYIHSSQEVDPPLDGFDYELAQKASERTKRETISFDEALKQVGMTYADIQD